MNSLQKHFSSVALANSYARNRRKFRSAGSAGIDGVGLSDFDEELNENLSDLSCRILTEQYRHKPLKAFSFEKSSGKIRWICVPTIRDRLVQRRLAEVILEDPKKLKTAFGFGALKHMGDEAERTAVGVALDLRQSSGWVVKTDISAFFDQIPRDHVKSSYRRVCRKRSLYDLIDKVVDVEASASGGLKKKMERSGIVWGRGLRQGMPLSPLLAHISLIELDRALADAGFKFVRYVDDLAFFGDTRDEAKDGFSFARNWLNKRNLDLPDIGSEKTELRAPHQFLEFLGIDIYRPKMKYRLRIPENKFKALEGRFLERTSIDFDDPCFGHVVSAIRFISSARKSYSGVYGKLDNWVAFEKKIKDYERRSIRSISRQLSSVADTKKGLTDKILKAFGVSP